MTDALHPDERALYEAQLRRRAEQLVRLLTMGPPPPTPLLAMFVGNLLRVAVPLCGAPLAAELCEWLGRALREQIGRCPFCGAERREGARICAQCVAEVEAVDLQLLDTAGGPLQ
jgi:hypothetical protein